MTWASVVEACRSRFTAEVARPAGLSVVFGNQPPRHHQEPNANGWARLSVIAGARSQVSTGAPGTRRFRTTGVVVANLFAPLDEGDGSQLQLVDAISDAFLGVRLELTGPVFIHFNPPLPYGEATVDEAWWRLDVRIPFHADDFGGSEP